MAVEAGLSVAVARGNSGPGQGTVESPGRARKVITVAASTNKHFVGQPVYVPDGRRKRRSARLVGDFPPLLQARSDFSLTPSLRPAQRRSGRFRECCSCHRGGCTFSTKVRNADRGASIGVVVLNNVAGDPTAMAKDGGGGDNLPAVMLGKNEGAAPAGCQSTRRVSGRDVPGVRHS